MSTDLLVILPIILPLTMAGFCAVFWLRPGWQRWITVTGMTLMAAAAFALLAGVLSQGVMVSQPGNWAAPFGIAIVADPLSALAVAAASLVALAASVYAFRGVSENALHGGFFPLFCGLMVGVNGAFLTGDIFNLYVWFEVLLVCAIGLLVVHRDGVNLDAAVKYAALNLFGTTMFLTAVAFLYGAAGTLNFADLARVVPELGASAGLTFALVLFLLSLGVKAAAFPLFFWLPIAYHTTPPVVSALFGALLTKVGIYAAFRIFMLLFEGTTGLVGEIVVWMAAITMITGAIAALVQTDLRRMLAFLIVSGMGYLMMGLALSTPEGLGAASFYLIHDIIVKGAVFLLAGVIAVAAGSSDLTKIGGLIRTHPVLAVIFLGAGLSLAGLPPFSGFWAKVLVADAAFDGARPVLGGIALGTGLVSLLCVVKIWMEAFWKTGPEGMRVTARLPLVMMVPATALVLVSLAIGLYADPLMDMAARAGAGLADPSAYIEAVMGAGE
ncbi:cation:proton antiporter [Glycocaulis albus]|uniref:Cation:proton antiporter n=1 Tax=Glycocaulis albus TaxID=1382801 RepID=A0ABQ1XS84_9PROT|nr:proton-conducting transporter membrane subunit [Glycocaulis albus]GGH01524.1 cation:proton antiporter [Glycocaulis albus]